MKPAELNATLSERHDLTDELAIIRVRPFAGEVPSFEPGQFLMLGLPRRDSTADAAGETRDKRDRLRLVRRAYSIASSARNRDYVEFYVVRITDGRFTPSLWEMHLGERVWMDERAHGKLTLGAVPPGKTIVLVATGTGIGPFMSMVRTYEGQERWKQCVLINGVRRGADLGYRQELEQRAASDPAFTYIPIVSREPPDSPWRGLRGRVQDVLGENSRKLVRGPLDPETCEVLLCGNPGMIRSVRELLQARGFRGDEPGANLHVERYW